MPTKDERETVAKFDGRPGPTFDVYEEAILNAASGKTDERGLVACGHLGAQPIVLRPSETNASDIIRSIVGRPTQKQKQTNCTG